MAVFAILASYIIGSIPFGLIISYVSGYGDIRKVGSQNIGATNVFRVNKKLAFLTFILDALKGFITIFTLKTYVDSENNLLFLCSLFSVIGHIFPIWLSFKGGKGVSTLIGTFLAFDYYLSFIFIITWMIVFYISRYSSLSSIFAVITSLLTVFFLYEGSSFVIHFICSLLIVLQHYKNIIQLMKRQEQKIEL
ncbi:glycerol-3-phosphate 1-O-acyltransferase PlsY [Neoehrlichia mikurensis]|uniref:Glycerol-3-phosphate acyltransferase n=1 Tax=Neoehrlichia mikurensis TaxID=89586 RepID=A0A9Q9F4J1_9RICK|nr:glycerol-3-phosphate 1-O-acyltransferase PlsY [Neoehrlichia mikurensis]QXK92323.1 glycerol-3-phosphate 1-O-acyltransferase PlsY [Neoehrlichia mikurensis]QXK92777.1 glycerol-3-phosphate 1-O-acyltransferase PlsY [Neoehrlichia mikurensis]QXK94018.1 glycerol-3-phosphate 1-O-acyltransferase PlsY [Neoehrlichia mikurensis]UTO55818.1 glycerol-3-phosphate 1-O-acyltransferase PlsY [Neoehrlichia mikurensis]UTO56733.1 glycerol-3-phosphate 1-O-acyltransferase PlsY [Neoehrlichia mikurensis]